MTLIRRGDALTREGDELRSAEYDAGWNDCAAHSVKVIERLEARLATTQGAVDERDRAWRTIREIEAVLIEHGVAIQHPLADAVRDALSGGQSDLESGKEAAG
jgi:hypothetical protein